MIIYCEQVITELTHSLSRLKQNIKRSWIIKVYEMDLKEKIAELELQELKVIKHFRQ